MINFNEGTVNFGDKNILTGSDEDLAALAEEGLIEKREISGGRIYYYADGVAKEMRFGLYIRLREKKIEWIRLHWLDSSIKGWDDVSEKAVKDEYKILYNFVEKTVGHPPEVIKNRQRTWRFEWGQVDVSFDLRAFQADIFMVPQ